jgi:hypothetical protein
LLSGALPESIDDPGDRLRYVSRHLLVQSALSQIPCQVIENRHRVFRFRMPLEEQCPVISRDSGDPLRPQGRCVFVHEAREPCDPTEVVPPVLDRPVGGSGLGRRVWTYLLIRWLHLPLVQAVSLVSLTFAHHQLRNSAT